jgi:hypothetical protein
MPSVDDLRCGIHIQKAFYAKLFPAYKVILWRGVALGPRLCHTKSGAELL